MRDDMIAFEHHVGALVEHCKDVFLYILAANTNKNAGRRGPHQASLQIEVRVGEPNSRHSVLGYYPAPKRVVGVDRDDFHRRPRREMNAAGQERPHGRKCRRRIGQMPESVTVRIIFHVDWI